MKKLSETLLLWAVGGVVYYSIECFFRGFSHWSMFLLGGACLCFFGWQGIWCGYNDPLWRQVLRCTVFIGAGEFLTGIIVNKWMHWNVWDYSDQPLHLFGQICVPFLILFSGLVAIGIYLSAWILHLLYKEKRPHFHVL